MIDLILCILSGFLVAAIVLIPRAKTPLEKRIQEQQIPWEKLDQYDDEKHF